MRVRNRYTHYYVYADAITIILIFAALVSQAYQMEYAKLIIVVKFLRMFEFDALMLRKLVTNVFWRTTY